jgi:hypothetical protein
VSAVKCSACGKRLTNTYWVPLDADGVTLRLCAGCAGEAAAYMQYGSEAVCEHDWPAIRAAQVKP